MLKTGGLWTDEHPRKSENRGYEYTVERTSESFPSESYVCDGVHIFGQQKIKVAKTGNQPYQDTVFLHELVHGIIASY